MSIRYLSCTHCQIRCVQKKKRKKRNRTLNMRLGLSALHIPQLVVVFHMVPPWDLLMFFFFSSFFNVILKRFYWHSFCFLFIYLLTNLAVFLDASFIKAHTEGLSDLNLVDVGHHKPFLCRYMSRCGRFVFLKELFLHGSKYSIYFNSF